MLFVISNLGKADLNPRAMGHRQCKALCGVDIESYPMVIDTHGCFYKMDKQEKKKKRKKRERVLKIEMSLPLIN